MVLAEATQIHQVLMNLGTNASHAMRDRAGRLRVTLETWVIDGAHAATQPGLRPGVYACVSVSDTGCGMDQATPQRIFEPSFTPKPPGEGTGLGLAVVHGIMDNHGGAVTVYSEPGEGTVFLAQAHQHPLAGSRGARGPFRPAPPLVMARILLIDDDDAVRTMLRLTLAHFGHTVIEARDGKEGLELFQHTNVDLLITDIVMPEKEGLEVLMELRKKQPPVKIIAISGGDYLHLAKLMGAAKVLAKPFSTDVLIAAVNELLPADGAVAQ